MNNNTENSEKKQCDHCWHIHTGALHMVVKDGHIVESCCHCQAIKQTHRDHMHDDRKKYNMSWSTGYKKRFDEG